jgi:nitrate reductase alpha subunit
VKWIKDLFSPKTRAWEEFYRNRWQHDKRVRSTHGVNCTGGCSWNIFVKDGIVTWEMQALDYPEIDKDIPPYEPRGCQRGISFSWYLYSPIRVKYPYVRGALLDIWREVRRKHEDPVDAWAAIQADPKLRGRYQRARGKGGFRRVDINEALEICAASNVHTAKKWGPDRIVGFSPIPAMSQLSYASGARMLQLMGGICLSFYDWYCDLPPASPEIWGEQTDVAESADWYNAKMIAVMGSNLNMTRTPDCHYVAEARHNGTKLVVFSPDFSQVSKYADQWVAINQGQDGAYWMSVVHVILSEFYHEKRTPKFEAYVKKYTDAPYLIELTDEGDYYRPGRMLRAGSLERYKDEENGEWKFVVLDDNSGAPRMPGGSMGHRWQGAKGEWNLKPEEPSTGDPIAPVLTLLERSDETPLVMFDEFDADEKYAISKRAVPAIRVKKADGTEVLVTTGFDLLMGRYGVGRGLEGEYPKDYDDDSCSYTPAWQERWSGVDRRTVIGFAREWAKTADITDGRCCIIIGAGINHWYHNNLMYRAGIVALMLTGCIGKNGGGLNHYVGQEKLAPAAPWGSIAFAKDWHGPPRLQNAPSWHYMHSDQWRYEAEFTDYHPVPRDASLAQGHTADLQVKAVRNGWLPFYPQFNESSIEVVKQARAEGAKTDEDVVQHVIKRLKDRDLQFSVEDIDAEENWPRTWYIWRGNALMSSAKGHEYFLRHYLGTHDNAIAEERAEGVVKDVKYREAPIGKFDLIVDLNFRMDTSALYSDIILPAATWYEKDDLNSTDMHSFIHPLSEAVKPAWESRSDWDLFRAITDKSCEMFKRHFPDEVEDLVLSPLLHDTPAEISQVDIKDWMAGECEAIPGKTMPNMTIVRRNYAELSDRFRSFGEKGRNLGAHGVKLAVSEEYDELLEHFPKHKFGGKSYPSLNDAQEAANVILHMAPETNGEIAYKGYKYIEECTGVPLVEKLAQGQRKARVSFADLQAQPRRLLNSPVWSGLVTDGRAYSAFTTQVEHLVPWRTLTGRQHFYLDHWGYLDFGEHLPVYKPLPLADDYGDLRVSPDKGIQLNYLTPHGKWHIHSTYGDTHRMLTLSRGGEPCWLSVEDAERIGVIDNDYVEVHNDHGVVVSRCVVSHRIPNGMCIIYHSPERTIATPKSPLRDNKRAGGHNSLTRVRLKPSLMVGGYGQFTYHFNYWGPTGVNRDTFVRVRKCENPEI